jgi:putative transposase
MSKISETEYEYRHDEGSISACNYHFIFCPKRRKAVLVGDIAKRLQGIIFELCTEHGWKMTALEVMPDHVHFLVNIPSYEAPAQVAKWIKGRAARYLREEFPELKKLPSLWSRSYFVSTTGQVSTETVKRYIEGQKNK